MALFRAGWVIGAMGVLLSALWAFDASRTLSVPASLAPSIERGSASVVHLLQSGPHSGVANPLIEDPWFRPYLQFPQLGLTSQILRESIGSGVVIDARGLVVTSAHFAQDRKSLMVSIPGQRGLFEATVLGMDSAADLALLRIESPPTLKPVAFASSDELKVGDLLFAIGNPFGLEPVVSMGVAAAIQAKKPFIPADRFLHGGNVGGLVMNTQGQMVGMPVKLKKLPHQRSEGGFFLSSEQIQDIAYRIERSGSVRKAWLGISVSDLTQEMRSYFGRDEGVVITAVEPHSPADQVGMQRGDLVIMADDILVDDMAAFERILSTLAVDRTTSLLYLREKRIREVRMPVGRLEGVAARSARTLYHHGLILEPLSDQWRIHLNLDDITRGVMIVDVEPGSRAERSGFMPRDVIVMADGREVESMVALQGLFAERAIRRFTVIRGGLVLGLTMVD